MNIETVRWGETEYQKIADLGKGWSLVAHPLYGISGHLWAALAVADYAASVE